MRLAFVIAILILTTSAFAIDAPSPKVDPVKPVTVTLTVQDWQAVLLSVQDSAGVSARDANRISQTIMNQVRPQVAPQSSKTP